MQTVEVRFKGNRKAFFTWSDEGEPLHLQEAVVVEAERGMDLGRVNTTGEMAAKKCAGCNTGCGTGDAAPPAIRAVVRRAGQEEIKTANELRKSEEDVRRKVIERVNNHQLTMKVSDAEWQWDRNKLTVYFTAEKRVDFRALVRDLASLFRTRIELRQIGVRDEAARLTGVGRCGREYCCSTWLKYEHEFYVASRKRFPKEGKTLRTSLGAERVVAVDIFRERVFLRHEEQGPRIISLLDLREELERAGEPLPSPDRAGVALAPSPPEPEAPIVSTSEGPVQTSTPERSSSRSSRRRRGRRGRGGNQGNDPGPPASQN